MGVSALFSPWGLSEMLPSADAAATGAEPMGEHNVNGPAVCSACEAELHMAHCVTGPGDCRRTGSLFLGACSGQRSGAQLLTWSPELKYWVAGNYVGCA